MMKALKIIVTIMVLFFGGVMQAQVSVNVNLGSPPPWGPVGYSEARYYYLPDVEAYYDVPSSMFIYNNGGVWVHRKYLPKQYRGYDLYGGYKVVMTDYRGNTPYTYFPEYKIKYAKGYRGQSQKSIGEKPGKGNSKSNYSQAKGKSTGNGNNKMKKESGRGGGKGNKK